MAAIYIHHHARVEPSGLHPETHGNDECHDECCSAGIGETDGIGTASVLPVS